MSFTLTLISNTYNEDNTLATFTNNLAQRVSLDSSWVVGISEISYTKSWYNIKHTQKIEFYDEFQNIYNVDDIKIESGFYPSVQVSVDEINKELSRSDVLKENPILIYNKYSNKVKVKAGKTLNNTLVYPNLGTEIENLLGLREDRKATFYDVENSNISITTVVDHRLYVNGYIEPIRPVEISAGYHSILVYSDIIYPSLVGDAFSQILRIVEVPRKSMFGEQCTLKYERPQFHRLLIREFDSVSITLKDDTGENIPFKFGRTYVTLLFKKL